MPRDLYTELLHLPPGPRPPDHYTILGLRLFEGDRAVIHKAVLRQTAELKRWALHPDPPTALRIQEMLNEVNRAGFILEDPTRKGEYDRALADRFGIPIEDPDAAQPPSPRPAGEPDLMVCEPGAPAAPQSARPPSRSPAEEPDLMVCEPGAPASPEPGLPPSGGPPGVPPSGGLRGASEGQPPRAAGRPPMPRTSRWLKLLAASAAVAALAGAAALLIPGVRSRLQRDGHPRPDASLAARKPATPVQAPVAAPELEPTVKPRAGYGAFTLSVEPEGATVWIEGRNMGAALKGIDYRVQGLVPRDYSVKVAKEGYQTIERKVAVEPDHTISVRIVLETLVPGAEVKRAVSALWEAAKRGDREAVLACFDPAARKLAEALDKRAADAAIAVPRLAEKRLVPALAKRAREVRIEYGEPEIVGSKAVLELRIAGEKHLVPLVKEGTAWKIGLPFPELDRIARQADMEAKAEAGPALPTPPVGPQAMPVPKAFPGPPPTKAAGPQPNPPEPPRPSAAEADFQALQAKLNALRAARRYGEAVALCRHFLGMYPETPQSKLVKAHQDALRYQVQELCDEHMSRFRQAIEKGDIEVAKRVAEDLQRYDAPEAREARDRMLGEIKAAQAKAPGDEAQYLAQWETPPHVARLLHELKSGGDPIARATAAKELGRIGHSAALGGLIEALRESQTKQRGLAVFFLEALEDIGDPIALPHVVPLTRASMPEVLVSAGEACRALARAPRDKFADAWRLVDARKVAGELAEALKLRGNHGSSVPAGYLMALVETLALLDAKEAAAAIRTVLDSKVPEVRQAASAALKKLTGEEAPAYTPPKAPPVPGPGADSLPPLPEARPPAPTVQEGLEAHTGWVSEAWGSAAEISVAALAGTNNKMLHVFLRGNDKHKVNATLEEEFDLTDKKAIVFEVYNRAKQRVDVAVAFSTTRELVFYESPPVSIPPNGNSPQTVTVDLTAARFKCAATRWRYASAICDRQNVRQIALVIYTDVTNEWILFDNIRFVGRQWGGLPLGESRLVRPSAPGQPLRVPGAARPRTPIASGGFPDSQHFSRLKYDKRRTISRRGHRAHREEEERADQGSHGRHGSGTAVGRPHRCYRGTSCPQAPAVTINPGTSPACRSARLRL